MRSLTSHTRNIKKNALLIGAIIISLAYHQGSESSWVERIARLNAGLLPKTAESISDNIEEPAAAKDIIPELTEVNIVDKPVKWTLRRKTLAKEYTKIHYGFEMETIVPRAIVIHWTVTNDCESVYNYFYPEETTDADSVEYGRLNVTSHFLIDRNGIIYRLTPETALNRHAIGWNWCAIGIENVGGVDGQQNLTEQQLEANTRLVRYLKNKYGSIEYVLGHYQQDCGNEVGLWIENVPDYYAYKIDPGPIFMKRLSENLVGSQLTFFEL